MWASLKKYTLISRHLFQKSTVPAMLVYLKTANRIYGETYPSTKVQTSYFKWMGKKEPCETNQTLGTFYRDLGDNLNV